MKHTPGPWEKDYNQTIGHIKSVSKTLNCTPTVCQYGTHLIAPSICKEDAEANAHLIAAAPELKECLEDALLIICNLCRRLNPQHKDCDYCGDISAYRTVLSKAEGNS